MITHHTVSEGVRSLGSSCAVSEAVAMSRTAMLAVEQTVDSSCRLTTRERSSGASVSNDGIL